MSVLFSQTPRRRLSKTGITVSLALHVAGLAAASAIPARAPHTTPASSRASLTFVVPVPAPTAGNPMPEVMRVVEVVRPIAVPRIARTPVRETPPAPHEATNREVPKPIDAAPLAYAVAAPVSPPATQIELPSPENANATVKRPVESAGFGSAVTAPRVASASAGVRGAGFDMTTKAPAAAPGVVRAAGFDITTVAPAVTSAAAPRPTAIDRPVEVVFKPAPEYTEEARTHQVEGVVTLEVEFASSGEVRVLRVLHGLGHGLDESAARAAGRIRFKPAQSNGAAVDYRATVQISFRLS